MAAAWHKLLSLEVSERWLTDQAVSDELARLHLQPEPAEACMALWDTETVLLHWYCPASAGCLGTTDHWELKTCTAATSSLCCSHVWQAQSEMVNRCLTCTGILMELTAAAADAAALYAVLCCMAQIQKGPALSLALQPEVLNEAACSAA